MHRIATNLAIDHARAAGRVAPRLPRIPRPRRPTRSSAPPPASSAPCWPVRWTRCRRGSGPPWPCSTTPRCRAPRRRRRSPSPRALEGLLRRARHFLAARLGGG
ncbi:hypothetical protein ACFQU7_23075 [Pseudoroseomonas wenyumeiae]